MPAHVRKAPLTQRISAYLDVYDWLLWLSEELESLGWDQVDESWSRWIGFACNFIFLIARANSNSRIKDYDDGVFKDSSGAGWANIVATFFTNILTFLCAVNTIYTFSRKKNYRFFEKPVDDVASTPSMKRVKLNASPASSSPLRFLQRVLRNESTESRAHPDPQNDVWEMSVWDPLPVSLSLFCYFSPGHVILYWVSLPTSISDASPTTTTVKTILLAALMTFQIAYMSKLYVQQAKNTAVISKEVLREYDTKFVKPLTQPMYRDVSTQFNEDDSYDKRRDDRVNNVVVFTPQILIKRGFKTNPNPNYAQQDQVNGLQRQTSTPNIRSPLTQHDYSSPTRPAAGMRQPNFRPSNLSGGGNLGVYSHADSPLRKQTSMNFTPGRPSLLQDVARNTRATSPEKSSRKSLPNGGLTSRTPMNSREMARREQGGYH
ncbi:hypothetical protein LTR66_017452 [Elasticomyces elasticus]|nr:hypothetical protein LTR66_017452 [Elasticomyces elasticus]